MAGSSRTLYQGSKASTASDAVNTPKTPALGMYSIVADKKNKLIWASAQQVDKIFRFNPEVDAKWHYETYSLEAVETDRVLDLLEKVKGYQDGTLTFRRSCAHGVFRCHPHHLV